MKISSALNIAYFLHSGFFSNLRLPWSFSLYSIYFSHSGFLSNLCLPRKTECALKFFTASFRIFEQLALPRKKEFALKFFIVLNIFFIIQDMNNLHLPWKTECALKFFTGLNIFLHSVFLSNSCACPEKQICPEISHCIEILFIIQDFEPLALALKNKVCLEFFIVLKYFVPFWIFEQLALALKTEFALKFFKPGVKTLPNYPLRVPMHNIIVIGNFMSRSLSERDRRTLLLNSWTPLSSYDFRVVHTGFQKRRFQMQWLKEFKRLAYSEIHEGSLCKWCVACVCTWCCQLRPLVR